MEKAAEETLRELGIVDILQIIVYNKATSQIDNLPHVVGAFAAGIK